MKTKLRLVKNPEEEKLLLLEKEQKAQETLDWLILQTLCFKKYNEYLGLLEIHNEYNKNKDLNQFITSISSYRVLFDLGMPEVKELKRVKDLLLTVKQEAELAEKQPLRVKEWKLYILKIMTRLIVLKRFKDFEELSQMLHNLSERSDFQAVEVALNPYLELLNL